MPFADQNFSRAVIRLNGEERAVPTGMTVAALLDDLALDPRLVVVERNREILRDRTVFTEVVLVEGDTVELVHFVGGG
jgi:thiamine biosynthesis protein ThiS